MSHMISILSGGTGTFKILDFRVNQASKINFMLQTIWILDIA